MSGRQKLGALKYVAAEAVEDGPPSLVADTGRLALGRVADECGLVLDSASVVETNRWPVVWDPMARDGEGMYVDQRYGPDGAPVAMWAVRFEGYGDQS